MEQSISDTPHLRFLRTIRDHELDCALVHFPPANRGNVPVTVLEIGAGTGQQAKALSQKGYQVVAIDLPSSHYRHDRVFAVTDYDGRHIPMSGQIADVVFSSNVLEHVRDIDALLDEMQRVLKDDGVAIHILPSSSCRLWGIPSHYAWLTRRIFTLVMNVFRRQFADPSKNSPAATSPQRPRSVKAWRDTFFPARHGERGNTLSETYYFSRYWWARKFQQHGFTITRIEDNKVFYTMANGLADSLGLRARMRLAPLLGAACHIYVLERTKH